MDMLLRPDRDSVRVVAARQVHDPRIDLLRLAYHVAPPPIPSAMHRGCRLACTCDPVSILNGRTYVLYYRADKGKNTLFDSGSHWGNRCSRIPVTATTYELWAAKALPELKRTEW